MDKTNLILLILMLLLITSGVQFILSHESNVIEGKVTNAVFNKEHSYVSVTFDNNETYRLDFPSRESSDFTVNSKLILCLYKFNFWLLPNTHNVWQVDSYLKVPGD